MDGDQLMYRQLAPWFPLLSAPEEYEEEAGIYTELVLGMCPEAETMLELGSGAGSNASHLRARFEMTLLELSPDMIEVSRALNPGVEHVEGDMRTVRLGRTFDAVFVHDAIVYMTTEADLQAAMRTAFEHTNTGGVALFAPDWTSETFRLSTDCGGSDGGPGDDRSLRYLEWVWDPDPHDCTYIADYTIVMRTGADEPVIAHDRHLEGLFPRATWISLLESVGFEATSQLIHGTDEPGPRDVFLARRP